MKRLAWLVVAFALLVTGTESLKVLVAWWQAGRPAPGMAEILAFAALLLAGVAWWRHSVFACKKAGGTCLLPPQKAADPDERR
jgi:hypothetical protein